MKPAKTEKEARSFVERVYAWFDLRRAVLLLFAVFYLIKNYIKSEILSNPESELSLWDDRPPALPSLDPRFYESLEQTQTIPNRTSFLGKCTVLLFLVLVTLRRLNDRANQANK